LELRKKKNQFLYRGGGGRAKVSLPITTKGEKVEKLFRY